jgi:hypothetical protein
MADIDYQTVTGAWGHIIDDGILDDDPDPDEVAPTGLVTFTPLLGSSGSLPVGSPARSVSISPVVALVADGILTDQQGREGIRLVAAIGGTPVWWRATPKLHWAKVAVPSVPITFGPGDDGTVHLNDLIGADLPGEGGDIRHPTPVADLNLPTVGDFEYSFRLSGGDFPTGAALAFLIGTIQYPFTLSGNRATITITGDQIATIPAGTDYWLLYAEDGALPGIELQTGKVRKVKEKSA